MSHERPGVGWLDASACAVVRVVLTNRVDGMDKMGDGEKNVPSPDGVVVEGALGTVC